MTRKVVRKIMLVLMCIQTLCGMGCSTYGNLSKPEYQPPIAAIPEPKTRPDGGLFFASTNRYIFEAIRANQVGDLLTVVLVEETQASKSASLEADKETTIDFPNPTLFGKNDFTVNANEVLNSSATANREVEGEGELTQENSLNGNITVTVTDVLPNGYLLIKGEKLLTLNEGSEVVRISGVVRPTDISPANMIESNRIGNAHITYTGNGAVSDSSKSSWLYRFFTSVIWPL